MLRELVATRISENCAGVELVAECGPGTNHGSGRATGAKRVCGVVVRVKPRWLWFGRAAPPVAGWIISM